MEYGITRIDLGVIDGTAGLRQGEVQANCSGAAESTGDAASTAAPQSARSYATYDVIVDYFCKRMEQDGISSTDAKLDKLAKLLFAKRQVSFESDHMKDTKMVASDEIPIPMR